LKIVPGDDSTPVLDLLDPISFETAGSQALFNDGRICQSTENETYVDGKLVESYTSIKMVRTLDDRSLFKAYRNLFLEKAIPEYEELLNP